MLSMKLIEMIYLYLEMHENLRNTLVHQKSFKKPNKILYFIKNGCVQKNIFFAHVTYSK